MRAMLLAVVISLYSVWSPALANDGDQSGYLVGQDERGMVVSKLFTKPDEKTYFKDVVLPFAPWGTIMKSDFLPAKFVEYYHVESGYTSNLHSAPANQVLFIVTGTLVIESSSGETREFPPGSAVWVTDTGYDTDGHKTWVKGDADVYAVVVVIDEKKVKEQYR